MKYDTEAIIYEAELYKKLVEEKINRIVEYKGDGTNNRDIVVKIPGRWPTNTWFQNRLKKVRIESNGS